MVGNAIDWVFWSCERDLVITSILWDSAASCMRTALLKRVAAGGGHQAEEAEEAEEQQTLNKIEQLLRKPLIKSYK